MDQNKRTEKEMVRLMISGAIITVITACLIILFYFVVKRYEGFGAGWDKFMSVWQAIIMGFVFAFLLNPVMGFFEVRLRPMFRKLCKTELSAKKTNRMVSSILALVVGVGLVILILFAIIPELYKTVVFLVNNLGNQIDGVLDWANEITRGKFEKQILGAKGSDVNKAIDQGLDYLKGYIDLTNTESIFKIATSVMSVGKFFINILIGIFVSIYVLMSKEQFKGQFKKILYGICKTEHANTLMEINRKASDIFYGFIIGKIIDSIIIGLICYVSMLILKMPYAMLVSVIIGVTNIIPVFGPYIGAVPTVIIIFLTSPMQGIYFLVYVIILQQIDGNVIGPKILGDSTGLSSFWVVVAIVVGGGLFGIPGMLIGVPTMALIYYLASRFFKYMLRRKGLPEETVDYIRLEKIDPQSKELIEHDLAYYKKKRVQIFANRRRKAKPVKADEEEK